MKGHKKSFISGFLLALILMCGVSMVTGSGASATNAKKSVTINYKDIKICIDGQMVTPKDANGKVVEPFILDGTTYLPVRAVGEAFGKAVDYDGKTHTVYVGQKPSGDGADGTPSPAPTAKPSPTPTPEPTPTPTPEPTPTPDPTPSVPSDPKEILSFIRFGKEYGPFTMKNYKDTGYTDTKPATTNSVTSLVFTDAGTYGPIGGYPVTMRIKGTSEADSICFWLQAYDADGKQLCNRIVTVSDGITAGQPYDVTVTSYLALAAPGNSLWNTTKDPFNAPSKVARIALKGGTSRQSDFVYFDTNGNQVDG